MEASLEESELGKCAIEIRRLRTMLLELGADPTSPILFGRSKTPERSHDFGRDSQSPPLGPSLSLHEDELDPHISSDRVLTAEERPLLKAAQEPQRRESGAVPANTEYSRLTRCPDEGYGA